MRLNIPETGYLRLNQIVGQKEVTPEQAAKNRAIVAEAAASGNHIFRPKTPRPYIPALLPISKSSWWSGVAAGRYPKPVALSARITAWKAEDIRKLLEDMGNSSAVRR